VKDSICDPTAYGAAEAMPTVRTATERASPAVLKKNRFMIGKEWPNHSSFPAKSRETFCPALFLPLQNWPTFK
jgi:hypothetical protein